MANRIMCPLSCCGAATLLALWGIASACQASILLPKAAQMDVEQLLTQVNHSTSQSSSSSGERSAPSPTREPVVSLRVQMLGAISANAESTTGTSTSSTGTFDSGGLSCVLGQTVLIPDDIQGTRLAIQQALCLPDPLGAELFHPPRSGRS